MEARAAEASDRLKSHDSCSATEIVFPELDRKIKDGRT